MRYAVLRCCTRIPRDEPNQMRTHFREKNNSSTSLEGMERPVRSFKSFIRTTPPHPTETEESFPSLPLTPAPWVSTPSDRQLAHPRPVADRSALNRNPSVASWKAPAEWYNGSASEMSAPSLSAPTSAPRGFAPLIPEPSPGLPGMETEPMAWIAPSAPPPPTRLLPIYERTTGSSDLAPPGTPPGMPLPAPPAQNQFTENKPPPDNRRADGSPGGMDKFQAESLSRTDSDASTKEKAFASLGLDASDSNQRGRQRTDRTYLRGKKLQSLNKGSPLSDDSWEDEEMDDKTRELSFSQDYHDMLADQYQEMNVRAQEVLSSGGAHQVYDAQIGGSKSRPVHREHGLIPRPLSWQKTSGQTTPRSRSRNRDVDESSGSGLRSKHKRLSTLLAHRFGALDVKKEDGMTKGRHHPRTKQTSSLESDRSLEDELRFSKFFPSSRPIKFGKKHKRNVSVKSPPEATPPQPSPLIRLPGGLAVVRTHSPSPASKSDIRSDKSPTSQHTRNSSQFGSDYSHTNSDHRSSCNSHTSQSPATVPVAMRSAYRTSVGSSNSHRSNTNHALAQNISPPALPPPPPVIPPSPTHVPPLSPKSVDYMHASDKSAEHRYTPKFIEKAKESRRRRAMEARQDKLKRSIKVLGPTDPGVAQSGYVKSVERFEQSDSDVEGRVPGYMVKSGPS